MTIPRNTAVSADEKPLVTFALFAYNQEKYIREAVEAAFSQNYSPLEIILSDDGSSDSTFEIMESLVKKYQGENTVRLNKNSVNLGIIGHVNKVIEMSKGQFVVTAAGDDISIPERTNILVGKWISTGKTACSIFTNATIINNKGELLGPYYCSPQYSGSIDEFIKTKRCWLGGFSHGFSKELYFKYGPITKDTFQEDGAIAFRALLNTGIFYVDQLTVFYRRHTDNSYDVENYRKFKKLINSELGLVKGQLADLKKHAGSNLLQYKSIEKVLKERAVVKLIIARVPGVIEAIFIAKRVKCMLNAFKKIHYPS